MHITSSYLPLPSMGGRPLAGKIGDLSPSLPLITPFLLDLPKVPLYINIVGR